MSEYPIPPKERRYVPASLSEVQDLIAWLILSAPKFRDGSGLLPWRNIDTEFEALTDGFDIVRKKVGEERYATLVDLAARAKGLFADDPDDTNGKTDQGRDLLFKIEDVIQAVRGKRVAAKDKDDEGEVTGD